MSEHIIDQSKRARSFAQHDARLQFQAQGERAQRDIDQYNAWLKLLMMDPRARAIMEHYRQTDETGRVELARLVAAEQASHPRARQ